MIYLYLKTHNQTGMRYLGRTIQDPHKYRGSGRYWSNHLKKYGYDITTEILLATESESDIRSTAMFFSKLWNIAESKEFANLVEETGKAEAWNKGLKGVFSHDEETKNRISEKMTGFVKSAEHIKKIVTKTRKEIEIRGEVFSYIGEAVEKLNENYGAIRYKLNSDRYPDYVRRS